MTDEIQKELIKEAEQLKTKGGLEGLHNLVRQNVAIDKRNKELISSIDYLNSSTSFLSKILIFIGAIGLILALPQFLSTLLNDLKEKSLIENFILNPISIIWLIFAVLFIGMSIREYIKSKRGLDIKSINLGFSDLNDAYKITRKAIIEADKGSHKIAATSYFLAGLTALASLTISLI